MKPERFYRFRAGISMIRKSGNRFCDKIMRQQNGMIRKSGNRFCDKIMRQQNSMIRKSMPSGLTHGREPVLRQDRAPANLKSGGGRSGAGASP